MKMFKLPAVLSLLVLSSAAQADDRADLASYIEMGQNDFCEQKSSAACQDFTRFKAAKGPHLPVGRGFTIGRYYFDRPSKDGIVANPMLTQALFFENKGKGMKVRAVPVTAGSPQEAADAAEYIKSLYKKVRLVTVSTHAFLEGTLKTVELLPVTQVPDGWIFHDPQYGFANGLALVRQLNNELFILRLAGAPKFSKSHDSGPALSLTVLPVPS